MNALIPAFFSNWRGRLEFILLSIICFKLAEITNGNELENSKYGQNTGKMSPNCQIGCRLQMDSKSRDFWQDERKRFNLIRNIFIILI